MEKKTFEEELNDIIREAAQWRAQGEERTDDSFSERDTCLGAIANAITNYVTVEITRRLTVPSEPTPPAGSPKRPPTTPSTPRRIRPSLNMNEAGSSSTPAIRQRPGSRAVSRPTTPLGEPSTLKREPMYHSENRLCRFTPTPRADETPLENKASRLRRLSTERRRSIQK